ncbi:GNAT family protein [Hydrogenophaga sp.]|uniref:GNAT family N-acetyltransferase n=1 Tax=Hydrogenophaga sp. TaxID=1904254 RepID=UPI0025C44043|nr:GNAT family protein [Hydrogenophaga sp.]
MNPPQLEGQHVSLRLMSKADAGALVTAASDGELWHLRFTVVPNQATIDAYVDTALQGWQAQTVMPFVTVSVVSGSVIGSTRFWRIDPVNRSLEIGHTWLAKTWQRSAANTEAKYLMLRHAFDALDCVRVQFTTDVLNEASRAAILRLGAVEEGLIRNERIMPDGRKRSSMRYSIIDTEWPAVRSALERRLSHLA